MIFIQYKFWLICSFAGIVVRTLNSANYRKTFFPLFNLAMIYNFMGKGSFYFLILFTLGIAGVATVCRTPLPCHRAAAFVLLTVLFIGYKNFHHDPHLFFQFVPFSYVYLRSIDVLNSHWTSSNHGHRLNFLDLSGFLMPVHMSYAGPIDSYRNYLEGFCQPAPGKDFDSVLDIAALIAKGFFYKFFCAESIKLLFFGKQAMESHAVWQTSVILVYTFFDFSGYTCLSNSVGKILGMHTPSNFFAPFAATSVTQFYTRWHISLGDFIKRNFYFPLQMNYLRSRVTKKRYCMIGFNVFCTCVCFAFIGLWHGLKVEYLMWGLSLGAIIGAEKLIAVQIIQSRWAKTSHFQRVWAFAGPIYTLFLVSLAIHPVMNLMLNP